MAQGNYAEHFHAVDRNDRGSADCTVTIRTNRWYMRVFFWIVDRVIQCLFVVVVFCAKDNVMPEWWALYLKKGGCHRFQIDLGMALINYALENEWEDINGPRPNSMRQRKFIPCDCKQCFFCKKGFTTGIAPKRKAKNVFVETNKKRPVVVGHTMYASNCRRRRVALIAECVTATGSCADGKKLTAEEKKSNCNWSTMACVEYDEQVCHVCWEKGCNA